ncbi:PREDICTED: phorbol-12-myristate-13-acetate-induced protein 1 [Charadrius vociferus]|uniref:phorbol-12-myristate-13-acetate-induced protein 1 n=1 Tax=Charadrius vociferus TaxID=50402 RepID=UPI00052160E3|nr:PREDICTED: phorbol-12-myristate-13-acetate-induced protein 1 [Charadrius vociferus]
MSDRATVVMQVVAECAMQLRRIGDKWDLRQKILNLLTKLFCPATKYAGVTSFIPAQACNLSVVLRPQMLHPPEASVTMVVTRVKDQSRQSS